MIRHQDMPLGQIVEVEWQDAVASRGWMDIEQYRKELPIPCKSVGYLLEADKKRIILIQSQNCLRDLSASITIPKTWIVKVRKLGK